MTNMRRIWLIRLKNRELYCALCGELIRSRKDLNADHKQAKSKGGATINDNLQPTHKWCNEARGNVDLKDWSVYSYVYLKTLVERWKKNKTKYNKTGVYKSLTALKQR